MSPFYITTPIYYVNDKPHIGHCYSTLLADVAARFQRLIRDDGRDVFFLTGTDEHADKVVTSAAEHGVAPQEWADRNAAEFRRAFEFMGCRFDDFIRTTEPRHKEGVVRYIEALLQSGDIYQGEYTGWYDQGQEEYVTETVAKESGYKSPINGRPLVKRTEPCYFFRLSKYQQDLDKWIGANPACIQPDARKSEVLGRLRLGLNDVPISRPVTDDPATQWGIRIPGDPGNRVYVWIDALFNYLTTVDTPERRRFWPATVHLIGKDILWFHAVIWPALLMALRARGPEWSWVAPPRTVFGHGWWISEGQKMSKSLGNFIDLDRLKGYANRYSLDALRWYLATQGPLAGTDADFSHAKFVEVYNADLANGIGNCASRVGNMIGKYFEGKLPENQITDHRSRVNNVHFQEETGLQPGEIPSQSWFVLCGGVVDAARNALGSDDSVFEGRFDLNAALGRGTELVRAVDGYINLTEPFKIAKRLESEPGKRTELAAILYNCAEALRIASLLLSPAMPDKMAELWKRWSCAPPADVPLAELARFGGPHALKPGTPIDKGDPLFMRADPAEPAP